MKLYSPGLVAGAVLPVLMLAACVSDAPWGDPSGTGKGTIKLNLSTSPKLEMGVQSATRATAQIAVPPAENFSVSLRKADGSYSKTWQSVAEFNREESFPVGTYTLTAFHGDPKAQGHCGETGHENAYFEGTAEEVGVAEDQTTPVPVTASLANAAVQVTYTDAFKGYFKDWSTTLSSGDNTALKVGKSEDVHFITPSDEVRVLIGVTYQNGKTATLNGTSFKAGACRLHNIRYNVANGEVGQVFLEISFPDNVDEENVHNVTIDLSEFLDPVDAPVVNTFGVAEGEPVDAALAMGGEKETGFNISSKAGIAKAELTVTSENYKPSWLTDGKTDLCAASGQNLQAMEKDGLTVTGLKTENAKLAVVDLTGLLRRLPEGSHKFELLVTDPNGLVNEPECITVNVVSTVQEATAVSNAAYGAGTADVTIEYQGPDVTLPGLDPFTFSIKPTADAGWSDPEPALSKRNAPDTRAFEKKTYLYTVGCPTYKNTDKVGVKVYCHGREIAELEGSYTFDTGMDFTPGITTLRMKPTGVKAEDYNGRLKVKVDGTDKELALQSDGTFLVTGLTPGKECTVAYTVNAEGTADAVEKTIRTLDIPYSLELDALATKVKVKLTGKADNISWTVDGAKAVPSSVADGVYTFSGLTASANHSVGTEYTSGGTVDYATSDPFTTEAAGDVPNGNFSQTEETIHIDPVQVGGQYNVLGVAYTITSSIVRNTPTGWATVNDRTCWTGSSNKNTWFVVPSTFVDGEAVTVRSVGYSHAGTTPSTSGGGFNTKYYCENAPSDSQLEKAAGELFLGSYSFNGSESRTDGIAFASRPSGVTVNYKYAPQGNEMGLFYVRVLDASGAVIAEVTKELGAQDNATTLQIPLPEYPFGKKAAKLVLGFKSSTATVPGITIPTGSALNESAGLGNKTKGANNYHAFAKGSELTVTSVKLTY